LNVPITIEKHVRDARIAVTLKHHYRDNPKAIAEAEELGIPIYVLRSNTAKRMEHLLKDVFNVKNGSFSKSDEKALQQTQGAIQAILNGERIIYQAPSASDGNPSQPGFSFLWEGSQPASEDFPGRFVKFTSF